MERFQTLTGLRGETFLVDEDRDGGTVAVFVGPECAETAAHVAELLNAEQETRFDTTPILARRTEHEDPLPGNCVIEARVANMGKELTQASVAARLELEETP